MRQKDRELAPRRGHISNFGNTTEHSRTVSKFSLGGPNRLTTRAIRFGNGKSIRKAWMERCPPWTLFEPGDRLARFVDRGADRPGNKVCILPPVQPADELIRSEIALGHPFTACQGRRGSNPFGDVWSRLVSSDLVYFHRDGW